MTKFFRTLRGFLHGGEPAAETYFAYGATLRIHGDGLPFDEITERLRATPTLVRRKGDRLNPQSKPYRDDAWHFSGELPETEPLEAHIDALWGVVKPRVPYLLSLKRHHSLDIFLGYRTNCDHAGVQVPHTSLEIFTALEVPFGVSIIVTS